MATLAETQRLMRNAVAGTAPPDVRPLLVGGVDPVWRLGIHRRHYQASLVGAIQNRYPATAWLIGDRALTEAALHYLAAHPPRVFCIAEFGGDFPRFLGAYASLSHVPYLEDFAQLEWHVGYVSVAVASQPLTRPELALIEPSSLMESTLVFQPGVVYMTAAWPVETLMRIYLSDQVPPQLLLSPENTHVEVRGARGDLEITTLTPGTWHFRSRLQAGLPISLAADDALERDSQFDPGRALVELCDRGLVVAVA